MPAYPHIQTYYSTLKELIEFGGSDNELNIRPAFQNCLDAYCREHKEKLVLIPELKTAGNVIPDGTVKDTLRMARGYWEAKDSHDDLDAEIQRKFNRGYPRDNIVFEDSETAILVQNGDVALRVDMSRPGELHRLIRRFLDYELPNIEEFRQAQVQFKADLPAVLENLRQSVAVAEEGNADYLAKAGEFLALCRRSIGPDVAEADVREMLLQHILTKDIFLRVFAEDQFHRENNVAGQLDDLEGAFFTGNVRREAIDRLRAYYGAIGRAADEIADYAEKQQFLKAIYEDFYKAYNPAAADRLGVVYTPNEVVDFIIRGTDHLLQKHFGKSLADRNVQILDPATGTGTFITNLINYLPPDRLEHKYRREIHANEVAILPYYIANLNIEYTYRERTGQYLEFPNLCFVDTLDNLDWQQQGATGGAVTRQGAFNLGALSEENWLRVQEQNEKPISVIIGNPPYNDGAESWGDGTANREYPEIERRIADTYTSVSTARKQHADICKSFIRWASDRLADEGVIGFITNRTYIDGRSYDGFRKVMAQEFSDLYIVDLGGNSQSKGKAGNIFGIRIGVAVGFFVRRTGATGSGKVHYYAIEDGRTGVDKLAVLKELDVESITFREITPSNNGDWLNQSSSDYANLLPIVGKGDEVLANLICPGVKTDRDDWVYDFEVPNLLEKVAFFSGTYNGFLESGDESFNPVIKWSRDLRNEFARGRRIVLNDLEQVKSLYRPFIVKHYFANYTMSDVLTRNHFEMFGEDLRSDNEVICVKGPSANSFSVLAAKSIMNEKFVGTNDGGTYCLPLYRYTADGERVCNITEWGLQKFNDHYRQEWGGHFEELAGPEGITAEDIFAYTYAVLHDPVYRHDYRVDLLREFPRLPFYHDFPVWRDMGRELLDLHIGFEAAEPYPLERADTSPAHPEPVEGRAAERAGPSTSSGRTEGARAGPSTSSGRAEGARAGPSTSSGRAARVMLRADKERGAIVLDDRTTLTGVPPEAWQYQLGSRSALEWVLDQYKEKKPRDPTIAEKFNTYKFADHKERVIDLLQRVCTVSVKTVEIVNNMAYWNEDGNLVVYGDRDKHEWMMLGLSQWFGEPGGPDDDPEYQAWLASLPDIREQGE